MKQIIRRPLTVILPVLAITVFFICCLPRLSFRTSVYDLVIDDLPETGRYNEFKKIFGSDEIIRLVIKGKDVFDPVMFRQIEEIAKAAARIKGIRRVVSLPGIKNAVDIDGKKNMEEFAALVAPVDMFRRNLISDDRKTTIITLALKDEADKDAVISSLEQIIAKAPRELSLYQIGMPLVSQALSRFTEMDFFRLPVITFLIIAVILFCLFRSLPCILLSLACVILALIWNFGLMALIGVPLSMVTMIIPVFLIAVGTAYCLHIISEYLSCAGNADSSADAVFMTFSRIAFPTSLAVFTTVIGLGSLLVNRITAIREFAVFSCFGISSLLVIVLTFLPATMSLIPPPKKNPEQTKTDCLYDIIIEKIINLNLNYQKVIFPVTGFLVLFCIAGMFRIRIETNPVEYFKKDSDVSRHFHDIYRDMSGSFPVNVVMDSKTEDYFYQDSKHIDEIVRVQKFLGTLPQVDKTVSFADYMKLVNYALNQFDPKFHSIPEEAFEVRMAINNYRTMLGQDMLSRFMSQDFSKANILLLTHISSSGNFLDTRERILGHVRENFSRNLSWDVTGFGIIISASSDLLTKGQVKSLSLTLILIFGMMFALFLSFKVGLIAIVPNLFPIVVNFGVMGWLGIELSSVTSLIASIAIGLAVDDTIHYLVRFNSEFKKDLDEKRALTETLRHIGKPVIFTSVTISAGFSILMFSNFIPTSVFGIMMLITMISALAGDMIILPSLIQHVELVTLWDLLLLKLGKDPQKKIPLFKGLSRKQVHYILMAGSLKKIGTDEILFRRGEPSDSMYAVISGSMDVVDPLADDEDPAQAGSSHKLIAHIRAGDVVGEMGLVRSAPRSATIIAAEPSEFIQISTKMIKRLQWLYPPTSHKFFFNLMTILCDRLERTTQRVSVLNLVGHSVGPCIRKDFLEILESEIRLAHRNCTDLSVCFIEADFEVTDPDSDYDARNVILWRMSGTLSREIRKCDTLGRLDTRGFAVLMPRTSVEKAEIICEQLRSVLKEDCFERAGLRMSVGFGFAGLLHEKNETGSDFVSRAMSSVQRYRVSDN